MPTQLTNGATTPEWRPATDRIVTDQLIPVLETEPGYPGALNLPDQANGDRLTIVLFQTEAQARRALAEPAPASWASDAQRAAASRDGANAIVKRSINRK